MTFMDSAERTHTRHVCILGLHSTKSLCIKFKSAIYSIPLGICKHIESSLITIFFMLKEDMKVGRGLVS